MGIGDGFYSDTYKQKFYDVDKNASTKEHRSWSINRLEKDVDDSMKKYKPGYIKMAFADDDSSKLAEKPKREKKKKDNKQSQKSQKSQKRKGKGHASDIFDFTDSDDEEENVDDRVIDDGIPPTDNPAWYPPHFVSRKEWGSDPFGPHLYELQLATKVIVAYSDSDPCETVEECKQSMRELQRRDKAEGFDDILHNFYIGSDGNIYEGRGWLEIPDTPGMFKKDVGRLLAISLIGKRGQPPGELRQKVFLDFVELGRNNWLIGPHADITWLLRKAEDNILLPSTLELIKSATAEAKEDGYVERIESEYEDTD